MNKVAIVTGALGGIGYSVVKKLYDEGFYVAAMDILPEDMSTEKIAVFDGKVKYVSGDLSKEESRKELLAFTLENFGRVDVLVNVAGVAPKVRADILEMTEESYDFVMGVNVRGTMFLTQLVANQMLKQNDDYNRYIVNISSMSAYTSSTSRGEYCVSKAGVSMVTKLFADRLANEKILVNEVRPGIIATGMTETVKEKYDRLIDGGILPIKRWGKPEDISNAVYALCSGLMDYTTGQSLDVDGGFHIQRL